MASFTVSYDSSGEEKKVCQPALRPNQTAPFPEAHSYYFRSRITHHYSTDTVGSTEHWDWLLRHESSDSAHVIARGSVVATSEILVTVPPSRHRPVGLLNAWEVTHCSDASNSSVRTSVTTVYKGSVQ